MMLKILFAVVFLLVTGLALLFGFSLGVSSARQDLSPFLLENVESLDYQLACGSLLGSGAIAVRIGEKIFQAKLDCGAVPFTNQS